VVTNVGNDLSSSVGACSPGREEEAYGNLLGSRRGTRARLKARHERRSASHSSITWTSIIRIPSNLISCSQPGPDGV
jgi:hypothetical protein